MGIAHSIPRHERIGLSEPVRKPREKKERKVKKSSMRTRKTKRKVKKSSKRTSPVRKRR